MDEAGRQRADGVEIGCDGVPKGRQGVDILRLAQLMQGRAEDALGRRRRPLLRARQELAA